MGRIKSSTDQIEPIINNVSATIPIVNEDNSPQDPNDEHETYSDGFQERCEIWESSHNNNDSDHYQDNIQNLDQQTNGIIDQACHDMQEIFEDAADQIANL